MRRFAVSSLKCWKKYFSDSFSLQPKQLQPDYVSSYKDSIKSNSRRENVQALPDGHDFFLASR